MIKLENYYNLCDNCKHKKQCLILNSQLKNISKINKMEIQVKQCKLYTEGDV